MNGTASYCAVQKKDDGRIAIFVWSVEGGVPPVTFFISYEISASGGFGNAIDHYWYVGSPSYQYQGSRLVTGESLINQTQVFQPGNYWAYTNYY